MTEKGLELYEFARKNGLLPDIDEAKQAGTGFPEVPDYFTEALRKNPTAEKYFNSLAPSYKLHFLGWIMDAKRIDTRHKRLAEAISLLESGRKLGMK